MIFLGEVLLPLDILTKTEPWLSETVANPDQELWNPEISDVVLQYYPVSKYAVEGRAEGLPFWDPSTSAGMPGLARGFTFTNPVFQLFSHLMPVARAMTWADIVQLFIGAVGMYLLLRELGFGLLAGLVSGLVFAFNGYVLGWLEFVTFTGAMMWLPLVFWGVERALRRQDWRWLLAAAGAYAMQILSGHILAPFNGAITLGIWLLVRAAAAWRAEKRLWAGMRPLVFGGLALGAGAALTMPALLLTAELFLNTRRTGALGETQLSYHHEPRAAAAGAGGDGRPLLRQHVPGKFQLHRNGSLRRHLAAVPGNRQPVLCEKAPAHLDDGGDRLNDAAGGL